MTWSQILQRISLISAEWSQIRIEKKNLNFSNWTKVKLSCLTLKNLVAWMIKKHTKSSYRYYPKRAPKIACSKTCVCLKSSQEKLSFLAAHAIYRAMSSASMLLKLSTSMKKINSSMTSTTLSCSRLRVNDLNSISFQTVILMVILTSQSGTRLWQDTLTRAIVWIQTTTMMTKIHYLGGNLGNAMRASQLTQTISRSSYHGSSRVIIWVSLITCTSPFATILVHMDQATLLLRFLAAFVVLQSILQSTESTT